MRLDEKALTVDTLAQEIRRVDGNHWLGAGALAEALMPFITSTLSPGSTGETEVTEAMVEAGHETARAWTDRYMDGSEFVNWQQGLPDIYRAMLSAAGER